MNPIERAAQVVEVVRRLGHESALVGGLAVSAWTRERFTKDIDLAVAVASDAESERLATAMQRAGFELTTVVEQEALGVLATLRFRDRRPAGDAMIDLVCGTSGIEREAVAEAAEVTLASAGVTVPVARVPHLIAMKVLSESELRLQDRADLQMLLVAASEPEVRRARELVDLITSRGFDRGRDLRRSLRELEKRWRSPGRPGRGR